MKLWVTLVSTFLLSSCATAPKKEAIPNPPAATLPAKINYDEIQNRLGLDIAPGRTGFQEKQFDACDLGPAIGDLAVPLKNCHRAFFSLIKIQLSCRESDQPEGVLGESDLRPVSNQHLKYNLGDTAHETETNGNGELTIREITQTSQKRSFLRVSTGIDFLAMRANEAMAIVVTPSWCGSK